MQFNLTASLAAAPAEKSRRQVLQSLAATSVTAAAAGSLYLPSQAWSQTRFKANPFALGVASGSPGTHSVLLWTRLLGADAWFDDTWLKEAQTVRWEIAHDEALTQVVQSGHSVAVPELGHSLHVEVQGLAPDRWYFYRFSVNEAQSAVGRTRTLPLASAAVQRLRMAYASCQRFEHGHFGAYRHMLNENLDAVLFLGDYIYESAGGNQPVRVPTGGVVRSLSDYRQRYALYKSDPDLQAMHAACPWLVTWDDHEVENDYFGLDTDAAFLSRRAAAYQAFYEHMPLRPRVLPQVLASLSSGAEMRVYGQWQFGQLAQISLLDSRQYRDAQVCTRAGKKGSSTFDPNTCQDWANPKRSLLGQAQEQWLTQHLKQAGQQQDEQRTRANQSWTVLAQQSLFGPRATPAPQQGTRLWNDSWDGYAPARKRLTQALQNSQAPNPVILGGDIHENWVGHVLADYANAKSEKIGVEFCGTSITSRSGIGDRAAQLLSNNPHFTYANGLKKGYGVVEFTPNRLTTSLRAVDALQAKDAPLETLANFVVEAGRSQVEQA
jgi:alkaline phosphatase D